MNRMPNDRMLERELVPFAVEIQVKDFNQSLSFYTNKLDFSIIRMDKENTFGALYFYNSFFMIKEVKNLPEPRGVGVMLRFIMQHGLEEYYEKLKKRKIRIIKPLKQMSYGLKRFYIEDPDGYQLKFASK